jgi:hypothetical protein
VTTVGEILELLHDRRRVPVVLLTRYLVWCRVTEDDGQGRENTMAVNMSRTEPLGVPEVDATLAPSGDQGIPYGDMTLLFDLMPVLAASTVRVGELIAVADRPGWQVWIRLTPQLSFPPLPLDRSFGLFPLPDEPAEWEIVIDRELGIVAALRCRVGEDVVGVLEVQEVREEHGILLALQEEHFGEPMDPADVVGADRPARPFELPNAVRDANIVVDDDVVASMAASTGACWIVIECADAASARGAVDAARAAVWTIPHPEEPEDPLPSFVSDAEDRPGGSSFWFDMADAEAYDGLVEEVLTAIVVAAAASGLRDARITSPFEEGV